MDHGVVISFANMRRVFSFAGFPFCDFFTDDKWRAIDARYIVERTHTISPVQR